METTTQKLRKLPNMGELVIDGVVWTKFNETREFKVSPKGTYGDYDTDSWWVSFSELDEEVTSLS